MNVGIYNYSDNIRYWKLGLAEKREDFTTLCWVSYYNSNSAFCIASVFREGRKKEISELQPRHLSSSAINKLTPAVQEYCKVINSILVTAANGNQEAQSYAHELVKLFKTSGCESDLKLPIPGLRADVVGIHIGVRNRRNIPEGAVSLSQILSNAGIQCNISQITESFFPKASFILIVGAKP